MSEQVQLFCGDCLDILPTLDGQVDAIITDIPYGTTACSWDNIIPLEPMWKEVKRLLKPRGVFVTTASQPFTSMLVMSNLKWFKYELIWLKNYSGDFAIAKTRPMKFHENILVFCEGSTLYYPQYEEYSETTKDIFKNNPISKAFNRNQNSIHRIRTVDHLIDFERGTYPKSYQYFKAVPVCNGIRIHPTQKPVALYEYLVRTYTNEGDTVLDFCMGSGTTGVACIQTGRNFIGIEKESQYFAISEKRIRQAQQQMLLPLEMGGA
jgi:site-specific DNA-methyltransferase (adenine-specific)